MPLLKDIASVQMGYHFRGKIENRDDGQFQLIQIKDVSVASTGSFGSLMRVNIKDLKPDQVLRKGDVILVGRGDRRPAVAIRTELNRATVGSQFFILRVNQRVDPVYLAWVLNQDFTQRYFEEKSVGTNVKILSKDSIANVPIVLPDLETQRRIAELHSLNEKHRELMTIIAQKRYQLTELALLDLIDANMKGFEV